MRLNGKLVGDITEDDLQQLCGDGRAEDQYLDYKRDAYGRDDLDKRELLKDVVGFANAGGGVILIGVEEDKATNAATNLLGVELESGKDPMERYERTILSGIEPRLIGVSIRALPVGTSGRSVIAIGIPQSFNRPHRVKAFKSERWVIRHNRDTIDMTYAEIRSAFVDGVNIHNRIKDIRREGTQNLKVKVDPSCRGLLMIYVIPLFPAANLLNVRKALQDKQSFPPPGYQDRYSMLPNVEGVRTEVPWKPQDQWWGWCQLFRDGVVEAVAGDYVSLEGQEGDRGRRLVCDTANLEADIFQAVKAYIGGLHKLAFNPPYAVSVGLMRAADSIMPNQPRSGRFGSEAAAFEPVLIEDVPPSGEWYEALRPIYDQLWNGFEFSKCVSFDKIVADRRR